MFAHSKEENNVLEEPELQEDLSRRGFLKFAIGALNGLIGLALAVPGLGYLLTPILRRGSATWINLGAVEDFTSGQPQRADFKYISESGYTRREKSNFVWVVNDIDTSPQPLVLSAICSHTGCNVNWNHGEQKFVCPCHEGRYDVKGDVLSGPPPRPLTQLPVRVDRGSIFVRLPT